MIPHISRRKEPPIISFYQLFDCKDNANVLNNKIKSAISSQKQMKSKQYPYEVYVLRKRVNLSSESGQLYSGEAVNRIRTGRQMLKNKA